MCEPTYFWFNSFQNFTVFFCHGPYESVPSPHQVIHWIWTTILDTSVRIPHLFQSVKPVKTQQNISVSIVSCLLKKRRNATKPQKTRCLMDHPKMLPGLESMKKFFCLSFGKVGQKFTSPNKFKLFRIILATRMNCTINRILPPCNYCHHP